MGMIRNVIQASEIYKLNDYAKELFKEPDQFVQAVLFILMEMGYRKEEIIVMVESFKYQKFDHQTNN